MSESTILNIVRTSTEQIYGGLLKAVILNLWYMIMVLQFEFEFGITPLL